MGIAEPAPTFHAKRLEAATTGRAPRRDRAAGSGTQAPAPSGGRDSRADTNAGVGPAFTRDVLVAKTAPQVLAHSWLTAGSTQNYHQWPAHFRIHARAASRSASAAGHPAVR